MTETNVEVFRGRDARAATLERLSHPAYGATAIATADLEGQFRIATAIANATEAVPRGYRKQPGAVLLALAWGQHHDVDILTTIQNVAFVEGKAVVDATMQRALAKRAGYELTITVGPDYASVHVHQNGRELGGATYSERDAELAGLSGKANWKRNPEDMLVARATTRAVRRFAPDVLLGMLVADEVDEGADIVELATPHEAPVEAPPETELEDPGEPTQPHPTVTPWATPADMRADMRARGIKTPDAVREAHALADANDLDAPVGTLDAIFNYPNPAFVSAFAAWVRNHDEVEG